MESKEKELKKDHRTSAAQAEAFCFRIRSDHESKSTTSPNIIEWPWDHPINRSFTTVFSRTILGFLASSRFPRTGPLEDSKWLATRVTNLQEILQGEKIERERKGFMNICPFIIFRMLNSHQHGSDKISKFSSVVPFPHRIVSYQKKTNFPNSSSPTLSRIHTTLLNQPLSG
jgi:hypothetical protein